MACDPGLPVGQASKHFTARYERRLFETAGHFLSRETPQAVVEAILDLGWN